MDRTNQLIKLHFTIQYFESIGAWKLAENFKNILKGTISNG